MSAGKGAIFNRSSFICVAFELNPVLTLMLYLIEMCFYTVCWTCNEPPLKDKGKIAVEKCSPASINVHFVFYKQRGGSKWLQWPQKHFTHSRHSPTDSDHPQVNNCQITVPLICAADAENWKRAAKTKEQKLHGTFEDRLFTAHRVSARS